MSNNKGQIQIMGKGGISSMGAINEKSKNNMNHQPQNKINMNYNMKSQINKNSENDFSSWKKIYNDEQKLKGKKNEKKMSKIKSGGEMVISNNKNKKQSNLQKPSPPNLQFNNLMNIKPQDSKPNFPYQQKPIQKNNNFYHQQIPINNMNNINQQQFIKNNMNYLKSEINNINKNENIKNNNNMKSLKMNKKIKEIESNKTNNSYHYIEYKPYTIKEYRELKRNPIIMGPLGANIGTKEWEDKKERMKRRDNYSNRASFIHKGITKLKKDNPNEEREKDLKRKYEKSSRYKSSEYCKLIQLIKGNNEKSLNNDYNYKNLRVTNENNELKNIKNINKTEPNYNFDTPIYKSNNNNDKLNDLQSLLQKNETYRIKIENLKDSLF